MVERFLKVINREVRGIHQAAYLLGAFAILSQILALLRDRLFASAFGAGTTLDVYYAAFRLPDLLFAGIASLVSVYVLIPFFSEKIGQGREQAQRFLSAMMTGYLVLMGVVSAAMFILAPKILPMIFSGALSHSPDLILLCRILLIQPFLLGLSSLFGTITQYNRNFFLYSLSPILYNVGIISGVVFLYPRLGLPGLVWGVVLGALFHVAIQIPYALGSGYFPKLTLRISFKEFGKVIFLSLPRTLALSANQFALLVIASLASTIGAGSIAIFNLSLNLQSVPLAIIGVSYSVAAFPTLAKLFSAGQKSEFFAQISAASRHILFWSLPTIALVVVLRAQIVRSILGAGAFDWDDTRLTAAAIAIFIISLFAQSLVLLLTRGFYAAGKTATPLIINVGSAALSVALSLWLLAIFKENVVFAHFIETLLRVEGIAGTPILMLPLGYMIAQVVNAALLLMLFERNLNRFAYELLPSTLHSFIASVFIGFIAYLLLNVLDKVFDIQTFVGIFSQGLLAGLGAIAVGIVALRLMRNKEIMEIIASTRKNVFTTPPIAPEELEPKG